MKRIHFSLIVGLLLILACSSWGFLVHRTVAQLAIYELPSSMRAFFWKNKDSIVSQSVRPDVRRNSDKTEGPRHFIDIENYGDSAEWKMPLTKAEAIRIYSLDTLHKYGYVPYVVQDVLQQLTDAFRKGSDKDSILFYAIELCHYIGDANVPLHTSSNYDGQFTGQRGLHALWESTVPDQLMNGYKLRDGHKATYVADPAASVWASVRRAHDLVQPMIDAERAASKEVPDSIKYQMVHRYGRDMKVYTAAYGKIYGAHLGSMVQDQLQHSADQIADFWYTAWVNAGKPDLDNLLSQPLTKKDKKDLRIERKAYRKNKLIEKDLLLSRHQPGWE
ncbi:MAG TPA: zinc dependent phospholipase C family protein [Puia sp.]|nr:zinc dependent phospholipase C family protein [Puia sp.]